MNLSLNPYETLLSLIDVFFVAIPLLTSGVRVDLPIDFTTVTSQSIHEKQHKPLVVTIDRHGKYYLGMTCSTKVPVSEQKLRLKLKQTLAAKQNTPVLLCSDSGAPYQAVVKAMALLQTAGAEKVGFRAYGTKK